MRVTKIFARRTQRGIVWIHYNIDAFACAACAEEHAVIVRPDPDVVRQALRGQLNKVLPILLAGAVVLGCGVLLATIGVTAASRHSSALGSATIAALGLGVGGIGLGLMAGGWLARRAIVCPAEWPDAQYAVDVPSWFGAHTIVSVPASALARAVDFSDDRSAIEEPPWRSFAFTRPSYAQEFARLNARYVYDRLQPPPKLQPRDRRALYYAAAAALAAAAVWLWS